VSRRYGWHLDYFSGALADLPKKLHGSDEAVLAVLREQPRFSVWDATATPKIAKTLDRLKANGRIRYDQSEGYPWSRAIVEDRP
jgi:hypothetical protein